MGPWLFAGTCTAVLLAGLAVFIYARRPPPPLWPVFFYFLLAELAFVIGTTAEAAVEPGPIGLFWLQVLYTGVIAVPPVWWFATLAFAEAHAQPFVWARQWWVRAPAGIASLLWLAMLTNPWHGQFLTYHPAARNDYHWLWWVNASHSYLLLLTEIALFGAQAARARSSSVRIQALMLMAGTGLTLGANACYVFWPAPLPFDVTVLGMGLAGVLFLIGIYAARLFSLLPAALPEITRHDPDGVVLLDRARRLLYANPAAHRLLSVKDLTLGAPFIGQLAVALREPDGGDRAPRADDLVYELTNAAQPPDGHVFRFGARGERWLRIVASPIPGRHAAARAWSLRLRDETALHRATDALRNRSDRLRRQREALAALATSPPTAGGDLQAMLRPVTEAAAQTLEVEFVSVWLFNEAKTQRTCVDLFVQSTEHHMHGLIRSLEDMPDYNGLLDDQLVIAVDDVRTDPRTKGTAMDAVGGMGISSDMAAPVRLEGQTVGVVFFAHVGPPRVWTADEESFAQAIAEMVALAMETAERRRAEESAERTLRAQEHIVAIADGLHERVTFEAKLRFLTRETARRFDAEFVQLYLLRPGDRCETGCPFAANPPGEPFACHDRSQCLHRVSFSVRYPEISMETLERTPLGVLVVGRIGAGEFSRYTTNDMAHDPNMCAHQALAWLGLQGFAGFRLVSRTGDPHGAFTLMRRAPITPEEVTALATLADMASHMIVAEQAKLEHAETEERYHRLIANAPLGIAAVDRDGRLVTANQRMLALFGAESEEVLRERFDALHGPILSRIGAAEIIRRCLESGAQGMAELRWTTASGQEKDARMHYAPIRALGGAIVGAQAIVEDITEQKRTEQALRESEERYRFLATHAPDMIWAMDPEGTYTYVSPGVEGLGGFRPDQLIGKSAIDSSHNPDQANIEFGLLAQANSGTIDEARFESEFRTVDGVVKPTEVSAVAVRDAAGRLVAVHGVTRDITERKEAEARLARTARCQTNLAAIAETLHQDFPLQEKLDLVTRETLDRFDADFVRVFLLRPGDRCDSGCLYASVPQTEPLACCDRTQCLHLVSTTNRHPDVPENLLERVPVGVLLVGRLAAGEFPRYVTNDVGRDHPDPRGPQIMAWLDLHGFAGFPLTSPTGKPQGVFHLLKRQAINPEEEAALATLADTVSHVVSTGEANLALARSERGLARAQEIAHLGSWEWDIVTDTIAWSEETYRIFGTTPPEFGATFEAFLGRVYPEDRNHMRQAVDATVNAHRPYAIDYRIIRRDGTERWVHAQGEVLRDEAGRATRMLGTVQDITDRRYAEDALRRSERSLARAQEIGRVGSLEWDLVSNTLTWSDELLRIHGVTAPPDPIGDVLVLIHPDDRTRVAAAMGEALYGDTPFEVEYRVVRPSGGERLLHARGEILRAPDGRPTGVTAVARDVTEERQAQAERQELERQMQHAQKLESLGVLAGGIAHDFNNLLTSILGNTELALMDVDLDSPLRPGLEEIRLAAVHAAELTKQMLAYSGKGHFIVAPLDLGQLIRETAGLLRTSLPKGVVLQCDFAANLPPIMADAAQMRQVIMNLIMNAGEAIQNPVGTVIVSTRLVPSGDPLRAKAHWAGDLAPGEYICLEVLDTGVGMDDATQSKVFEPFFTTKFQGRGLGLAAVLGIIRGHNGAIHVESAPGYGATFQVLLPVATPAGDAPVGPAENPDRAWQGSGTVLVVDDEEYVRGLAARFLSRYGFSVLTAEDGLDAVGTFRAHADEITLVLLDLTMPHLDGRATFAELRRIRPDVPVLLCSGYSEQEAQQQFGGRGLAGFVQKPYHLHALMRAVRAALDENARRDPG